MGDITFKKAKPQIFVFPKEKVFAKPGKISHTTFSKTKKGFIVPEFSGELEVVLGKGWAIKRGKTLATTIIEGKKVPIIELKKIRLSKSTRNLVKDVNTIKNKLDLKKIPKAKKTKLLNELKNKRKKLNVDLKKQTGFSHSKDFVSYRKTVSKKYFPVKRKALSLYISKSKLPKRKPSKVRRPPRRPKRVPRRPPKRIKRVPRRPPRRPRRLRRPVRPIPRRKPRPRPPIRPRPTIRPRPRPPGRPLIIPRVKKRIRKRRRPRRPQSFEVWARPLKKKGQRKPKLIKVSKRPLSKKRAQDLRNYITDTSLSRRAMIRPSKGKIASPRLKTPRRYARRTSHKFRTYKIRKGKRVYLKKGSVLEKSKYLLDRPEEIKQITLKRRIAQLSRPLKKRKLVKRKPTKRKRPIRRDRGIFG
jgi:hypothetical protein